VPEGNVVTDDTADRSRPVAAATLTLTALAIAGLSMLLPHRSGPLAQRTTAEHVEQLGLSDTSVQRRAHLILVFMVGVGLFCLSVSPAIRETVRRVAAPPRLRELERKARIALPFALVLTVVWEREPAASALGLALALGATATAWVQSSRPRFAFAVAGFLGLYAGLVLVPGLLKRPDLSSASADFIEWAEWHYSIVVSQGDRLAKGLKLFTEVTPHYGFLGPAVLGLAERHFGLFSFGKHIRIVQVAQILFCLVAACCYYLWSGRKWLPTAICALPVLASAGTLHVAVFHPNQSGWRSLGFPVGLLLLLIRPSGLSRSWVLGLAWGGLLLLNPEIGIVVGTAYLTSIFLEHAELGRLPQLPRAVGSVVVAAAVLPILFVVAFRSSFGYWPFPASNGPGSALSRFSSGYGGLRLYFDIGWVLILSHCLYIATSAVLALPDLGERRRTRAAIAASVILWFGYFFNRPQAGNLWTFYFLYGFMLTDFVQPDALVHAARKLKGGRLAVGLAVLTVILCENSGDIARAAMQGVVEVKAPRRAGPELSDVRVNARDAEPLAEKADFVKRRAAVTSLYYFTANSYFIPLLSDYYPDLPMADAYSECFTDADFERLVAWITTKAPAELLFDDPETNYAGPPERRHFTERLKGRLSSLYMAKGKASGWDVWIRRTD
jgi:hypothetical protein